MAALSLQTIPEGKTRYCDFCNTNLVMGQSVTTSRDTDRDLCVTCAKTAYELLTQQSLPDSLMSTLSSFLRRIVDADVKKLAKAGFLDSNLEITSSGQKAVLAILVEKFKPELVKEAETLLEEQKEAKS